jgi:hypothetical protein
MPLRDGIHDVTIFARDFPPESNLGNISAGTFTAIGNISTRVLQCANFTGDGNESDCDSLVIASSITQYTNYTFEINATFINDGPVAAYNANLSQSESPGGSLIYNETSKLCGNVTVDGNCTWKFTVTVPKKTPPGVITTSVVARWRNSDLTIGFMQNSTEISVSSNPIVNITQPRIDTGLQHGTTTLGKYSNVIRRERRDTRCFSRVVRRKQR